MFLEYSIIGLSNNVRNLTPLAYKYEM